MNCLSILANICCGMLMGDSCGDDGELLAYLQRVMTSAIIMFDHVEDSGAFCKTSPIQVLYFEHILKLHQSHAHCLKAVSDIHSSILLNLVSSFLLFLFFYQLSTLCNTNCETERFSSRAVPDSSFFLSSVSNFTHLYYSP